MNGNPWALIRELAEVIRGDGTEALDYMDRDSFPEGMTEDEKNNFRAVSAFYRDWLNRFEEAVGEDEKELPEPEEISREEFLKTKKGKIVFFSIRQEGADGRPGEFEYVTKELDLRSFRFTAENGRLADVLTVIPAFRKCSDLFCDAEDLPKSWKRLPIGGGKLLFYRTEYAKMMKTSCEYLDNDLPFVGEIWQEMAIDIIRNQVLF